MADLVAQCTEAATSNGGSPEAVSEDHFSSTKSKIKQDKKKRERER